MAGGRLGALGHDADEGLAPVAVGQHGAQAVRGGARRQLDIDGGEDTPVHGHQMGRETDRDRPPRRPGEALLDLRRVPVGAHPVGVDALAHLGEQGALREPAAGAADPRLGVDDDVLGDDPAGLDQGHQRQQGGGGIAARTGHQARPGDGVAGQFAEAVDRILLQRRRPVGVAVPAGVGVFVGEPEIGRKVDHLETGRERRDDVLRGPVGQAAKHHVDGVPVHPVEGHQIGQGGARQVGKDRSEGFPGLAVGGEDADLGPRMAHQEPHQFGARVSAGADDGDPDRVRPGRFRVARHGSITPMPKERPAGDAL